MGFKSFYRRIDLVNKSNKLNLISQNDQILLSFSGGQDSICLVFMLNQLYSQLELHITLFWCHHLWQTDSFYLMQQVAKLSFLFQFNSCFTISSNSLSSELLARKWRQSCSNRVSFFYNGSKICLAHTFNDKVETIFFNFMRGTGLTKLSPLRREQFISKSSSTNEKHVFRHKYPYLKYLRPNILLCLTSKMSAKSMQASPDHLKNITNQVVREFILLSYAKNCYGFDSLLLLQICDFALIGFFLLRVRRGFANANSLRIRAKQRRAYFNRVGIGKLPWYTNRRFSFGYVLNIPVRSKGQDVSKEGLAQLSIDLVHKSFVNVAKRRSKEDVSEVRRNPLFVIAFLRMQSLHLSSQPKGLLLLRNQGFELERNETFTDSYFLQQITFNRPNIRLTSKMLPRYSAITIKPLILHSATQALRGLVQQARYSEGIRLCVNKGSKKGVKAFTDLLLSLLDQSMTEQRLTPKENKARSLLTYFEGFLLLDSQEQHKAKKGYAKKKRAFTLTDCYNLLPSAKQGGLSFLRTQTLSVSGAQGAGGRKTQKGIARPLLSISRFEIKKICFFWKLPIYPDTSNQKVTFLRNRVRRQLSPTIKFFFNSKIENIFLQLAEIVETEDYRFTQIVNEFTKNMDVYDAKLQTHPAFTLLNKKMVSSSDYFANIKDITPGASTAQPIKYNSIRSANINAVNEFKNLKFLGLLMQLIEINRFSNNVSLLTKLIDKIAFQKNELRDPKLKKMPVFCFFETYNLPNLYIKKLKKKIAKEPTKIINENISTITLPHDLSQRGLL